MNKGVGTFLENQGVEYVMKRFFILLGIAISLSSFGFFNGIDEIVSALKSGNVSELTKYLDNTVEITLPEKSNSYSKSQAEVILRDFFYSNPIKGFNVIHKGENAGSQYCIGTLMTKNTQYRTTIFMKQKGSRQTLQEIRFENR
ncbi:MAG: DUF4783 domain-containing protein [Ferruginibacter sp.]